MHVAPLKTYDCPDCGRFHERVLDEEHGDFVCPLCGKFVQFAEEMEPEWFSVAIYETDRAYGGPEEGGWWYNVGKRIDETVRTFPNTDEGRYDAGRYVEGLHATRFPTRGGRWHEPRYDHRTFSQALPDVGFPRRRPQYS